MADLGKWNLTPIASVSEWNEIPLTNLSKIAGLNRIAPRFSIDRAVTISGQDYSGHGINIIQYFTLLSTGNASVFGSCAVGYEGGGCSNGHNERGIRMGGYYSQMLNSIDYVTINSLGNTQTFGTMTSYYRALAATDNNTNDRGVSCGGNYSGGIDDTIQFVTLSSIGNATYFGNLLGTRNYNGMCSNGINERALVFFDSGGTITNSWIEYFTINSVGNSLQFGWGLDHSSGGACSNLTNERALSFGGKDLEAGLRWDTIVFSTINSPGLATVFGHLISAVQLCRGVSSGTYERGVRISGYTGSAYLTEMDYVTISTLSDATYFGDLTIATCSTAESSDSV